MFVRKTYCARKCKIMVIESSVLVLNCIRYSHVIKHERHGRQYFIAISKHREENGKYDAHQIIFDEM